MKGILKLVFCLVVLSSVFGAGNSLAGEANTPVQITGEIYSITPEDSSMVIKEMSDDQSGSYAMVTVYTIEATSIIKGEDKILFEDLQTGDEVIIDGTIIEGGRKVANSIVVAIKE